MNYAELNGFSLLVDSGEYLKAVHWLRGHLGTVAHIPDDAWILGSLLRGDELRRAAEAESVEEAIHLVGSAIWARDGGELLGLAVLKVAAALSVEAAAAYGAAAHWFGDESEALIWLRIAIASPQTDTPWLRGLLGEACLESGIVDEAILHLRSGLEDHLEFGVPLSKALTRAGLMSENEMLLRRLTDAGEYGAAIRLGNLLEERGDWEDAEKAYVLGIASGDAFSAYNLGLLYERQGRIDESRAMFAKARAGGDLWLTPEEMRRLDSES